jgi:hypothetical protein
MMQPVKYWYYGVGRCYYHLHEGVVIEYTDTDVYSSGHEPIPPHLHRKKVG